MSVNPYQTPNPTPNPMYGAPMSPRPDEARRLVMGPAIGLMVVSTIFLFVLVLGFAFNILLLSSGMADEMRQPSIGISKETQITIRMGFAVCLFVVNVCILVGAIRMTQLSNLFLARLSAILAVIPCIGPCYILGIPFGIWALVVLSKPEVKNAFRS